MGHCWHTDRTATVQYRSALYLWESLCQPVNRPSCYSASPYTTGFHGRSQPSHRRTVTCVVFSLVISDKLTTVSGRRGLCQLCYWRTDKSQVIQSCVTCMRLGCATCAWSGHRIFQLVRPGRHLPGSDQIRYKIFLTSMQCTVHSLKKPNTHTCVVVTCRYDCLLKHIVDEMRLFLTFKFKGRLRLCDFAWLK